MGQYAADHPLPPTALDAGTPEMSVSNAFYLVISLIPLSFVDHEEMLPKGGLQQFH